MLDRIIRIIKLDFPVFKDIEADPSATTQAAIIVAAASVLSGIGSAFSSDRPLMAFLGAVVSGVVGWIVWSYVSHFVGGVLYKSTGTFESMPPTRPPIQPTQGMMPRMPSNCGALA